MQPPPVICHRRATKERERTIVIRNNNKISSFVLRTIYSPRFRMTSIFHFPAVFKLLRAPKRSPFRPRLVSCEPSIGESSAMGAAKFPPAAHQLKKWTSEPTTLLLIQKKDDPRTTAAMGFILSALSSALENTLKGPVSVLNRMRLACKPIAANGDPLNRCTESVGEAGWQVMNEVALHRGRHTHLTVVDTYFDGQHLTEAVADGILLSTPTGSTAYSLSAGGPISHPETDAFLLTPVAPRSLSFRTVILPGRGEVKLEISPLARSPAELSIDGKELLTSI
ncbi:hypothetical protein I307_03539 [Cryptococcus deuterogattii 99/473]|uniref:NAD(+) kinase n=1 Tax=Cryptococcus deuterogattii Ram5 TaxID=1296110 RepID=A0A0D0VAA9_9TREE|nr:hypothetical protein I309_00567 [Cryptococcus deuterogattii LA55]KIR43379.1 hypothetical protein I313_00221 [Cryptococcus deuterogattii Ram5]KIR74712.1 hypothetical protein I310_00986 [Cryptococcus deuterogattii CA1014]KIR92361.1 hypothetical protein I304_03765 [Cryptococcus deuterogattii CBS 10090]KIS01527.1 hypothetical protein L804_01405 [Cryptococcus deuterogattii 2001/935-1]KIY57205.1 hypothetical protein I307_03539 [Cryptococcus deuterogattii 99/473]